MEDKEILFAFKQAIDVILDRIDEMDKMYHDADDRMHKLESCLYEEILEPANAMFEKKGKERRHKAFGDKYTEMLSPYCDDYKKLYGDDLDLLEDCFKEYDELGEDDEKEAYIKKVIETIDGDTKRMKEKFGTPIDGVVEIEVNSDKSDKKSDEWKDEEDENSELNEWEKTKKMLEKYR